MSRAVENLDLDTLQPYLEAHVAGFMGPMQVEKFAGGQSNPTFKLTTASGTYVLRRQPPGKLLKSAHAVDREYRVLKALADTDVPVAKVYHLCEDTGIIGSMFYLMEYCEGRIYWDAALPEVSREERGQLYDEMNRVLAALHNVDIDKVGLSDYGRPGNYFQRQFDRWSSQYRASQTDHIEAMEALMTWLGSNIPQDDGRMSLVHGDYRLDNLMFHPTKPKAVALLDWELSTLGHPFADLGYLCMQMRMPAIGTVSGLRGKDLAELGIPDEQAYVNSYCQRTGIDKIDNFGFYIAFSFFRLAAIIQGVAKRAIDGNASNKNAAELGQHVGPLAEMALEAIADQIKE
ncbi:phosphotransferase family protein [Shewanella alkalitolerans]|uniref:phosphotransferase family protein n=1 Tax=Shewanella alkalitolerans TaxID=2864209 RepID=UPI001C65FDBA|nr:phosphotransferase family protein [Shewanella alkalitolerans]QYJ96762.1 phosphotransferase family protein [Shewanella alkalitolerans]